MQVRALKDYCNNYDLTSLNVKAGDIITVYHGCYNVDVAWPSTEIHLSTDVIRVLSGYWDRKVEDLNPFPVEKKKRNLWERLWKCINKTQHV